MLTIDQFEEVFSSDLPEQERQHFIDLLVTPATEPGGSIAVLLTLRADFYDRPLAYPALGRLIQQRQFLVLPMSIEDLREVIERPALLPDVRLIFFAFKQSKEKCLYRPKETTLHTASIHIPQYHTHPPPHLVGHIEHG